MLKETLLEDLKSAMKEKDVTKKNVIQMVRAAILQMEKDKNIVAEDNIIIEIIAKESKKRKDSLSDYEKSGRQDLVDQINQEIEILAQYLPEPLSIDELETIVKDTIKETGATSLKEMGKIMKILKEKVGTRAEGKTINEVVKKILQ